LRRRENARSLASYARYNRTAKKRSRRLAAELQIEMKRLQEPEHQQRKDHEAYLSDLTVE
jgi:hypothetical protein